MPRWFTITQDGHFDVVRTLLEHGVVDGLPDLKGRMPADLARLNGHAALARILNEGAVVQVGDPCHIACIPGNMSCLTGQLLWCITAILAADCNH